MGKILPELAAFLAECSPEEQDLFLNYLKAKEREKAGTATEEDLKLLAWVRALVKGDTP